MEEKKKHKFEVGSLINMVGRPNESWNILRVVSVDEIDESYTCNQGSVIGFDEEDDWVQVGTYQFESFGEHIRNILSPYANLVKILEDVTSDDTEKKDVLMKFLLDKKNIEDYRKNLEHFIEFSKLSELEELNWRETELFEKYSKEQEAEVDLEPATITVVEAVDDYKCERPDDIVRLEECSTCTGRQPNIRCPYMKIETVYRRKTNG